MHPLLRGELSAVPLMPKDFPFYYPEEHKQIIDLLESRRPAAVVAATGRNPGCGREPFPLFEDGAFSIPSAYLADTKLEFDDEADIVIDSTRLPGTSTQLFFSNGASPEKRIVVCAHMDTKYGTPGALDNAAGVATVFGVMERVAHGGLRVRLEFVPFNSEEYFGANGELLFLRSRDLSPSAVLLAVNLDGLGHVAGRNAFSFYNVGEESQQAISGIVLRGRRSVIGPQWYEGDHTMFVQAGIRSVAVTSSNVVESVLPLTHTVYDATDHVDVGLLREAADVVSMIVSRSAMA